MAVVFGSNLEVLMQLPNFTRDLVSDISKINYGHYDDGHIIYCTADKKHYKIVKYLDTDKSGKTGTVLEWTLKATAITLLGRYDTLALLQAAHPTGVSGLAYAVGTELDNVIYIWDTDSNNWISIGNIRGEQGIPGTAPNITIGDVDIAEEGEDPSVTNTGTTGNAILNFKLPRGKSAYELAVKYGFIGTEQEFAEALITGSAKYIIENIDTISAQELYLHLDTVYGKYKIIGTIDDARYEMALHKVPNGYTLTFVTADSLNAITVTVLDGVYRIVRDTKSLGGGSSTAIGMPVLLPSQYLGMANKPANFIIADPVSQPLDGETVENNLYLVNANGQVTDVLFAAIRNLQSEIAKLKNTFYYGICSLNEGNTASSNIIADSELEELEPLWAIDPEDLAEIEDATVSIGSDCSLTPSKNWEYDSSTNYVKIINQVSTIPISGYDTEGGYISPKVVIYGIIDATNPAWKFEFNFPTLESIKLEELIPSGKHNILFITSRRITNSDTTTYNKNFYWLSVTNSNGDPILLKYFDEEYNLVDTELDVTEIEVPYTITLDKLNLYRLSFYTKDMSFSNTSNILPERINSDDFIFRPAHITIRSVATYTLLQLIKDRIYNNELIWCGDESSDNRGLYIKYNNELIALGSTSNGGGGTSGGGTTTTKITATITLISLSLSLQVGQTVSNIAATNSTATIIYISSNPEVISVSGSTLTALTAGTATITAKVEENTSYTSAEATCNVTIAEIPQEEVTWTFGSKDSLTGEVTGGTFPIVFSTTPFEGTFPITLSSGIALSTFPINFN